MKEDIKQYTVNDYSQIDRHLDQVNNREKAFTDRIRIQNFFNFALASLIFCFAIGLLVLLIGWSFRLMFYGPKETKIIEKVVEHPHNHNINNSKNDNSTLNDKAIRILKDIDNKNNTNNNVNNEVLTDVTAFKSINTSIGNFEKVTTRWNYTKGDDTKPSKQSCYVRGIQNNLNTTLELAVFNDNKISSFYTYKTANDYKISKSQWDNLVKKCQWHRN